MSVTSIYMARYLYPSAKNISRMLNNSYGRSLALRSSFSSQVSRTESYMRVDAIVSE